MKHVTHEELSNWERQANGPSWEHRAIQLLIKELKESEKAKWESAALSITEAKPAPSEASNKKVK